MLTLLLPQEANSFFQVTFSIALTQINDLGHAAVEDS